MKKIATAVTFFCLLLMVVSGCASAEKAKIDTQKSITGEVIIEYKSVSLDINDVKRKMYYYLTPQNMTISDLSMGSDQAIWERFKNDIVFELAVFQIALEKADELGLNVLSSSELKAIDNAYSPTA